MIQAIALVRSGDQSIATKAKATKAERNPPYRLSQLGLSVKRARPEAKVTITEKLKVSDTPLKNSCGTESTAIHIKRVSKRARSEISTDRTSAPARTITDGFRSRFVAL
jgi:hypothetical protein